MTRLVYNSKEASALLGVSISTLLRITAAKKLNKTRISCKRVGWAHEELERFIENNTSDSRSSTIGGSFED